MNLVITITVRHADSYLALTNLCTCWLEYWLICVLDVPRL